VATAQQAHGIAAEGEVRSYENARRRLRRFQRNKLGIAGLAVIIFLIIVAIFAPWIAPYPDDAKGAINVTDALLAPSSDHFFGTDDLGADVFSRVVFGARYSLSVGLAVVGSACRSGRSPASLAGSSISSSCGRPTSF
jgi:peptide/nickel transport system permease protein